MSYVFTLEYPHGLDRPDVASRIGGKAANLAVMISELGLPVPPGFVISTDACRRYLADGWPDGLDTEIRDHVTQLEKQVGRGFGDANDPLLVSVRSGAPVSMPGMMDTILNLGLNAKNRDGLMALAGANFVAGCTRRLAAQYEDVVGAAPPEDPWEQLRGAVGAVFRSWNSPRARSFRELEGISDDLGTAVIVQAMVFGNRGNDSATGVVFTRNPATGEAALYGDLIFNSQGEDVVAGTHQTEPISVLDERMPEVSAELREYANLLERRYADACDIEFTIEQGKLWLLQTRIGKRSPQAALRMAVEMAEDSIFPVDKAQAVRRVAAYLADPPLAPTGASKDGAIVATGIGASPGVAVGEIATTPEDAVAMAAAGRTVVLVRRATSPDDVHGMAKSAGILTTTGGLASHAAVVARGWGIPAVVGASAMSIDGDVVSIGDVTVAAGDTLTIDGSTGEVFVGAVAGRAETAPEVAKLLSWATELGIEIGVAGTTEAEANNVGTDEVATGVTRDDLIRVMLIKGFAAPTDLAPVLFSTPEQISAHLDELVARGLAESVAGGALTGMFQLSADGKAVGARGLAADRETWGVDNARRALDDLLPLDQRMKAIVTDWQMREVDGQQVLNDHTDEAHDRAVMDAFASLRTDSVAWLASLASGLARLGSYVARLDRAADRVADGDTSYLASPRIDSFHNVWFELHEDLIRLAGSTREEEAAAGRA